MFTRFFKGILDLCSAGLALAAMFYLCLLVCSTFVNIRGIISKTGIETPWSALLPHRLPAVLCGESRTARSILCMVCAVGFVNIILMCFFSSVEIGSLYEKPSYTADYEAVVYLHGKPIYCIAEVSKGDSGYQIEQVQLSYGYTEDVYEDYDPDAGYTYVCLGSEDSEYKLVLNNPASALSKEVLDTIAVSSYGEYCASRRSETYHLTSCSHADTIAPKNFIYFESEEEAEFFGYTPCSYCLGQVEEESTESSEDLDRRIELAIRIEAAKAAEAKKAAEAAKEGED